MPTQRVLIQTRVTTDERRLLNRAAFEDNFHSTSSWMRKLALDRAKELLKDTLKDYKKYKEYKNHT